MEIGEGWDRMIVAGIYSFNGGREAIETQYSNELEAVYSVISAVDGTLYKTKISEEKTMPGKMLYQPSSLNKAFKAEFGKRGWHNHKVDCEYPTEFYTVDYQPTTPMRGAYRDMDFVHNRVGVEVQFGKYAFMVYNVAAKITIFRNLASEMSTGVSYFEQFVWDLEHRGVSDIDIPVLVLGISV